MALPTVEEIIAAADTNECCTVSEQQALTNIIRILGEIISQLPAPVVAGTWLRATSDGTPIIASGLIIAAPGAGFFLRIGYVNYSNDNLSGGNDAVVGVYDTDTSVIVYEQRLAPRSMYAHDIKLGAYDLPENAGLDINIDLTPGPALVRYTIEYQILPVVV